MIFIHSSSIVERGAKIGEFTSIWHYCHIEAKATIGENCNIGQGAYIGNNAVIGNACRIGNNVGIWANISLGNFVFCGPMMTFTHIKYPRAMINKHAIFEKTIVKDGVTFGANSTILPGLKIGEGSFIAAGSVLTRSCKDWALMVGCPAKQVGWVSAFGEKIPLPIEGSGSWKCKFTQDSYILKENYLLRYPGENDILNYVPGKKIDRISLSEIRI